MLKQVLCCTVAVLPIAAWADKLNLKPGLWESTSTTEVAGMQMPAMPNMPPEMIAKMPPEQRARIEAMMKNRGPGNSIVSKSCITEKDLQRGLRPEDDKEQHCKVDSVKTVGSTQEAHVTCTGERGKSTGTMKITATSREAYEGTMDMDVVANDRPPMNVKVKLKGKWLGANCGDVKPREDK